jgi:hypothetical protein
MDLSQEANETELYAVCAVCGSQWAIKSRASPPTDAQGCSFCNAGADAISIVSERADFSGGLVR